MKRFILSVVLVTLLTFQFGDVDVSSAQTNTDCIFINPNFNAGDGGWTLGFGVEQESGFVGMPNFSTIGQDVEIHPGDYNIVLSVFVWKEDETLLRGDDITDLISFYYQLPATGAEISLEPAYRTVSEFASEVSGNNIHQTFNLHVHFDSIQSGTFTFFMLFNHRPDGVYGVAVDRACIEVQHPNNGGGGGSNTCDALLPCGPLPWQLPSLPDLQSPTPFPTAIQANPALTLTQTPVMTDTGTPFPTGTPLATWTAFPTLTPYPTFTPLPTWTPFFDAAGFSDSIATMNAIANATPVPVYDLNGTPIGMGQVDDLVDNTGTVFSYIKGLADVNFGPLTPLITFMFTALFIFLFVKLLLFILPIVAALFGFIRKVIELILDFIPG